MNSDDEDSRRRDRDDDEESLPNYSDDEGGAYDAEDQPFEQADDDHDDKSAAASTHDDPNAVFDVVDDDDDDNDKDEGTSNAVSLIKYVPDYDTTAKLPGTMYQVTTNGGLRSYFEVAIADGTSIELLLRETYDGLEDVRAATPAGWPAVARFRELRKCLKAGAQTAYDEIVARDYPTPADKTDANYEELRRQIITKLSDHEWPGDKLRRYIACDIKYERCKTKDGKFRQPNSYLNRIMRLVGMGSEMHHNFGAVFMTDDEIKMAFWNSFPVKMQSWLTNEQDLDPFDPANPLDAQEIADHLQRYFNVFLKRSSAKRDDFFSSEDDSASAKAKKASKPRRDRNNDNGSNSKAKKLRACCPIAGHDKYHHDWSGCFLNPHSNRFNPSSADQFYTNQAREDCTLTWYCDTYERMLEREQAERNRTGASHFYDQQQYHYDGYYYDDYDY